MTDRLLRKEKASPSRGWGSMAQLLYGSFEGLGSMKYEKRLTFGLVLDLSTIVNYSGTYLII